MILSAEALDALADMLVLIAEQDEQEGDDE